MTRLILLAWCFTVMAAFQAHRESLATQRRLMSYRHAKDMLLSIVDALSAAATYRALKKRARHSQVGNGYTAGGVSTTT